MLAFSVSGQATESHYTQWIFLEINILYSCPDILDFINIICLQSKVMFSVSHNFATGGMKETN